MKMILGLVLLCLFGQQAIAQADASFVGAVHCEGCHAAEAAAWRGSHHDLAMAEVSEATMLGDFNDREITVHGVTSRFFRDGERFLVRTDGPDGELHDYEVRYTFGWYPLQQYLVAFPGGRFQALGLAWDARPASAGGQRWFHLYADEPMDHRSPLHWTAPDQNWNYQCAECHSTNLQKGYDPGTDTFATSYSEIDVACEACHGPGSAHLAWAASRENGTEATTHPDKGLLIDLADRDGATWLVHPETAKPYRSTPKSTRSQVELCARCHSRRGQIHAGYEYGKPLGNTHRLALLEQDLYFPDGQIKDEVYVYGSFRQSRMYRAGVTCSDCHDVHSLELRAQGNALCTRCHVADRYDTSSHHHHQPGSEATACTACHMPQRTYMVIDERADHSMRIPRPDLSLALGTPNACNGCHLDKDASWAADTLTGWFPESQVRGAHFGRSLHAAATGDRAAAEKLAQIIADDEVPDIARATAIDRLRPLASAEHLALIEQQLQAQDPLRREAALRFLEVTDVGTRVDLGWPLLEDEVRTVRIEAARVLASLLRQRVPDTFRRQLEAAVEEYRQAQRVNAERAESYLNLGLIELAVGDAVAAEVAYRTALQRDRRFAPGYANLADLYRALGREKEGEQLLRAGIDAVPEAADLPHALGLLLVRQKRLDEAIGYLERAAEMNEGNPHFAYVYALALQGTGKQAASRAVLTDNARRHPTHQPTLDALRETAGQP